MTQSVHEYLVVFQHFWPGSVGDYVAFYWPSTEDACYVPQNDIIGYISTPKSSSKRARKFKVSSTDMKQITDFQMKKNKIH